MTCPIPRPRSVKTIRLRVIEPHRHKREFEIEIDASAEVTSPDLRIEIVEAMVEIDSRPRDPGLYTLTVDLASTIDDPVLILARNSVRED